MSRDDEVVTRAKAGDPDAWRELYRAHAGRLLSWLGRRTSGCPSEDAEDLMSHTWLTAAARIQDFSGSSDDFAGWLFGIARRLQLNADRKTQRRQTIPADLAGERGDLLTRGHDDLHGGDPAAQHNGAGWVDEALATLSDREREVVTCADVLDLSTAATAEALGLSTTAVRVARHRGLTRLRRLLARPSASSSPP